MKTDSVKPEGVRSGRRHTKVVRLVTEVIKPTRHRTKIVRLNPERRLPNGSDVKPSPPVLADTARGVTWQDYGQLAQQVERYKGQVSLGVYIVGLLLSGVTALVMGSNGTAATVALVGGILVTALLASTEGSRRERERVTEICETTPEFAEFYYTTWLPQRRRERQETMARDIERGIEVAGVVAFVVAILAWLTVSSGESDADRKKREQLDDIDRKVRDIDKKLDRL